VNQHPYRVLFWFGVAVAGTVVLALLQGVLAPFAAAFAIAYLLRPAVDPLELYGTRRSCTDLAA
jgi:predicted PurR-regulated permease PerM